MNFELTIMFWLIKSEPDVYGIADLERDRQRAGRRQHSHAERKRSTRGDQQDGQQKQQAEDFHF